MADTSNEDISRTVDALIGGLSPAEFPLRGMKSGLGGLKRYENPNR